MQLAHAIDAWVDAHGRGLSVSTQRDIQRIRAAVIEVGWQGLPCDQVDREVREDIIEVATQTGTLGGSAISEFFNVVLQWAATQLDTGPSADDDLGSSGAFGDESEPTGWEDLDDDESDEPEPTGWEDLDDDESDEPEPTGWEDLDDDEPERAPGKISDDDELGKISTTSPTTTRPTTMTTSPTTTSPTTMTRRRTMNLRTGSVI